MSSIRDKLTNEKWIGFTFSILRFYIITSILVIITTTILVVIVNDETATGILVGGCFTIIVTCIVNGRTKYDSYTNKIQIIQSKLYYYISELIGETLGSRSSKEDITHSVHGIIKELHKYLVYDVDRTLIMCTSDIARFNYLVKMTESYLSDLEVIILKLRDEEYIIKLYRCHFMKEGIQEITVNDKYKNEYDVAKEFFIRYIVNTDIKLGLIIYALNELAVSTIEYRSNIEDITNYSQYLNAVVEANNLSLLDMK